MGLADKFNNTSFIPYKIKEFWSSGFIRKNRNQLKQEEIQGANRYHTKLSKKSIEQLVYFENVMKTDNKKITRHNINSVYSTLK